MAAGRGAARRSLFLSIYAYFPALLASGSTEVRAQRSRHYAAVCPELRRVSVSLRCRGGPGAHFVADYPVGFRDGLPEPIHYAGRRYSYSYTSPGGGYDAATRREVYVFVEDPPSEGTADASAAPIPNAARRLDELLIGAYSPSLMT